MLLKKTSKKPRKKKSVERDSTTDSRKDSVECKQDKDIITKTKQFMIILPVS